MHAFKEYLWKILKIFRNNLGNRTKFERCTPPAICADSFS